MGNSPGACYELFSLLKKLVRDLDAASVQCLPEMSDVAPLQRVFSEEIELMALLAWGTQPPEKGAARLNWFEAADLALFCSLRRLDRAIFGSDSFELLREKINSKLPGEAPVIRDGVCVNCDTRKNATQVLSPDEVWARSLFSIRCELY